jgi:hypothetical protein
MSDTLVPEPQPSNVSIPKDPVAVRERFRVRGWYAINSLTGSSGLNRRDAVGINNLRRVHLEYDLIDHLSRLVSDLCQATGSSKPEVGQIAGSPLDVVAFLIVQVCQNGLDRAAVSSFEVLVGSDILISASFDVTGVACVHHLIKEALAHSLTQEARVDVSLELECEAVHSSRIGEICEIGEADDLLCDITLWAFTLIALADCHKTWQACFDDSIDEDADLCFSLFL